MEGEQRARSAFRASVASLQSSLVQTFEDEYMRRKAAYAQELSELRHENEVLKHQLSVTDSLRAMLQRTEEKCSQLEDEHRRISRQFDLQKRQSAEYCKANSQLKLKLKHEVACSLKLQQALTGAANPPNTTSTDADLAHRSMPSLAAGLASRRTSPSSLNRRPNTAPPQCVSAVALSSIYARHSQAESVDPHKRQDSSFYEAVSRPAQNSKTSAVIRCSQSTEDGASLDDTTPIKVEDNAKSSPLEVTDVRTVRPSAPQMRVEPRRPVGPQPKPRYDGSERRPFLVKEETGSSPLGPFGLPDINQPLDSLDLDEITEFVRTPQKRSRLGQQLSRRLPEGLSLKQASVLGYDRAMSMPSSVPPMGDPHQRHANTTLVANNETSVLPVEPAPNSIRASRIKGEPTTPTRTARVLFPVSHNEQNKRRPRARALISKERVTRNEAVEDVTEDGEDLPASGQAPSDEADAAGSPKHPHDRAEPGSRLQGLLDAPSSQPQTTLPSIKSEPLTQKRKRKQAVEATMTPVGQQSASVRQHKRPNIGQYFGTTSKTSPSRKSRTRPLQKPAPAQPLKAQRTPYEPPPLSPSDEPLRSQPLAMLSLADFKINPDTNDGQRFAYAETIRTKEGKQCRPGCMDERCCGTHFRKMAQMGVPLPDTSRPRRSLMEATPSQEEPLPPGITTAPDLAMLEAHLGGPGGTARARIDAMSASQRIEEVVEARAALLAQRHGKHRPRFERRPEPDAFWDVDFPSTQQVQASKEAARLTERQRVEVRYKEALKGRAGKGRFLFRDE